MLGGTGHLLVTPLDLSALLQFFVTAFLIACGLLFLLKNAASRYFVVDTAFKEEEVAQEEIRGFEESTSSAMSIDGGGRGGDGKCFVCGNDGTKECSRCKSVRYCSIGCQSQHWNDDHKLKCRKKEFGPITLIPVRGIYKVLELPKKILFPYNDFMKLYYWDKQVFPPCGLLNCGNSCFANVVLQCLSCTRPLAGYFLEGAHSKECRRNDWCFLCELQFHIKKVTQSSLPFSPINILSRLPNIGSHLGYGRQEDAHEFMRFVVDTMQSVYLNEFGGEKALDPSTQETSLIQHIFGGLLQSQVICTKCNMVSNRYENMMDLTVEIQGEAESLEDCLDKFTAKEWLDGDNKYKCDGCNDYVKAWKRLTVHQAPNILTVTLKRFQSGRFGKLNKRVVIPETLDLGPYMSSTRDGDNLYDLYAIVVHLDMMNASFFGHYICYTKDFRGNWYRIDDCKVMKVEVEEVLSQGAYMLLYSRLHVRQPKTSPHADRNVLDSVNSESLDSIDTALKNRLPVNDDNVDANTKNVQRSDMAVVRPGKSSFDVLSVHDNGHTKSTEKSDMNVDEPGTSSLGKAYQESQKSHEDYLLSGKYESTNCLDEVTRTAGTSLVHDKLEENPTPSKCFVGLSGGHEADVNVPSSSSEEMRMDGGPSYDDRGTKTSASRSQASSTYQGTKPLFSRGFLNRQERKKSPQLVNQGICIRNADKCNGVSEMGLTVIGANPEADQSFDSRNKHVNGETKVQVENGKNDCSFKYDNHSNRKSDITNIESNGFLTKPCGEHHRTVEVSANDLRDNGPSREGQCHFEEISPEKESEQALQMCDSYLDLVCENGKNSLQSSLSSASNGFLNKLSRESENNNGTSKSKEMACSHIRSRNPISEYDPSEEDSMKHVSCLKVVTESDTNGFPDVNAPILTNGFLTKSRGDNKIYIKEGHSDKTSRPSIDMSSERSSQFGIQNFVSCQEMQCGNNTDGLCKSDMQFSSNGFISKPGDGCPSKIESNGYSDSTFLRSGSKGRAELLHPLKNKETEHEHDHEVSRQSIEECC